MAQSSKGPRAPCMLVPTECLFASGASLWSTSEEPRGKSAHDPDGIMVFRDWTTDVPVPCFLFFCCTSAIARCKCGNGAFCLEADTVCEAKRSHACRVNVTMRVEESKFHEMVSLLLQTTRGKT